MIVYVIAVRVVQATVDEVVDVVAVRHERVPTIRPMPMSRRGSVGMVATIRVLRRDRDHVLLGPPAFLVQQAPVVEHVDVVFVAHGDRAALDFGGTGCRHGLTSRAFAAPDLAPSPRTSARPECCTAGRTRKSVLSKVRAAKSLVTRGIVSFASAWFALRF